MNTLAHQFSKVLASATTERPIAQWLKKHPKILAGATSARYVTSEFSLGTDYRVDFVSLEPFSGGFFVTFIELERPNDPLFTRAGKPAKRLVDAMTQIDRWRIFIEKNRPAVLRELSKFFEKRELVFNRGQEPTCNAGFHLYDPIMALIWKYVIIAGRRGSLDRSQLQMKSAFKNNHDIELMTYDRVLQHTSGYHRLQTRASFEQWMKDVTRGLAVNEQRPRAQ